jgi:RNA recognition motif-containing protein
MNIYVGQLALETTEDELREAFAAFGDVQSVRIVRDGATGESRGFGFVEMEDEQGKAAIEALNGKEFKGNELKVEAGRGKSASPGGRGRRPGGRGDGPRRGPGRGGPGRGPGRGAAPRSGNRGGRY